MKLRRSLTILLFTALATVSVAWGQGFGGRRMVATRPEMLLQRDDVRADLQINDDQKAKLFDLQESLRSRFMEAFQAAGEDPEARKKAMENIGKKVVEEVNQILTPSQQERLKEIAIQVIGLQVVTQEEYQKRLGVTPEQKAKIADLQTRSDKATREAWGKVQRGEIQFTDALDTMKKNQKILNDELAKILTQAQKDKFKAMGGKPFVAAPETGSGL